MTIRVSFLLVILLTTVMPLNGQWKVLDSSRRSKPTWINEPPKGEIYTYYSGMGSSTTSLQQAQENAVSSIFQQLVEEGTFDVTVQSVTETSESIIISNKRKEYDISDDFIREVIRTGTSKSLQGLRKEEEYWQTVRTGAGLEYQFWVLIRVLKPGMNPDTDIAMVYGFPPVWRSVILPGWGQRFKGEHQKGTYFLVSEATAGTVAFLSFYLSKSYSQKAENEQDVDNRKFYNSLSIRSYAIGIISSLVAGGIHAYNIFDAMTAPGAKRYAQSSKTDHKIFLSHADQVTAIGLSLYF